MADWINDAGHGGKDPGAVSKGNTEKVYTLEAELYVHKRLKEHGINNDVTRSSDVTLDENPRVNKVKNYKYCLSHHFNAGGGTGVEFIHSIYSDGKFEAILAEEFKKAGYPVRRIFDRKGASGDYYYMHRRTGSCRTTIIEYDFLDGANSEKIKNKKYREGMYECVVKAVCRQEGKTYKPLNPSNTKQKESSKGLYKVQVGAFSVKENAETLEKKLHGAGFKDAYIKFE